MSLEIHRYKSLGISYIYLLEGCGYEYIGTEVTTHILVNNNHSFFAVIYGLVHYTCEILILHILLTEVVEWSQIKLLMHRLCIQNGATLHVRKGLSVRCTIQMAPVNHTHTHLL